MAATSAPPGITPAPGLPDAAEEAHLARAAAAGDGAAFAALYGRYERRIFNFCLRLVGSSDDAADATQEAFLGVLQRLPALEGRELDFSAYLFAAARNASYDVIARRRRSEPAAAVPEPGDPGEPEADPERAALLGSLQRDVRDANARLPERQREVLALRELEELSYVEIASVMEMNRNSVAQLLWRARIRLRDELRGTALASIAASSAACERALPLLAMRQDRELADPEERGWLAEHLAGCETCRASAEAIQEAGISYRAWLPILPAAWLWHATAARAAELVGADWSELAGHHPGGGDSAAGVHAGGVHGGPGNGAAAAATAGPATAGGAADALEAVAPSSRLLAVGLLALALLLAFSAAVAIGTDSAPRRVFAGKGTGSLSSHSTVAAASGAATARPTHRPRRTTTRSSLSASAPSTSASTDTGVVDTGSAPSTPRRRTGGNSNGNSLGGRENHSTPTPTGSTPPPSPPSSPAPSEGGTAPAPGQGGPGTESPGGEGGGAPPGTGGGTGQGH